MTCNNYTGGSIAILVEVGLNTLDMSDTDMNRVSEASLDTLSPIAVNLLHRQNKYALGFEFDNGGSEGENLMVRVEGSESFNEWVKLLHVVAAFVAVLVAASLLVLLAKRRRWTLWCAPRASHLLDQRFRIWSNKAAVHVSSS